MRSIYLTQLRINGDANSINPGGNPCKALKKLKAMGFDTLIVRFLDVQPISGAEWDFIEAARDCHGFRVILMVRLYDPAATSKDLWEYSYYMARLISIAYWAQPMGFEWGLDCEWYGVFPWAAAENASLAVELGAIIHYKLQKAREDSGVNAACMRVVGSSRVDKTNQPYAALADVCIDKTGYWKITKDTPDGPVITPPPSVLAPYIDPATKRIIPTVQASAQSNHFQPKGSSNWLHTYAVDNLPAGELFCYVDDRDIVAFLEAG